MIATINLHKRLHKISFKKRAPRAVREIKKFASKLLWTEVRISAASRSRHRRMLGPSVAAEDRRPAYLYPRSCGRAHPRLQDVRVDSAVNKYIWSRGVRNVPYRVRVKLSRRRNEDDDAKNKMYTLVTLEDVKSFKSLVTQKVTEAAE